MVPCMVSNKMLSKARGIHQLSSVSVCALFQLCVRGSQHTIHRAEWCAHRTSCRVLREESRAYARLLLSPPPPAARVRSANDWPWGSPNRTRADSVTSCGSHTFCARKISLSWMSRG